MFDSNFGGFQKKSDSSFPSSLHEVGQVFSENWENIDNWEEVGTADASVSGNILYLGGVASTSTNYLQNTSYGKTNFEYGRITWTEVVGSIGASTSGIAFALQANSSLGAGYSNKIMVNVELSTTNTGSIKWYSNGVLKQTSSIRLTPIATNVLNCSLMIYPDKYEFHYNINGGRTVGDTFYIYTGPGFASGPISHNAAQFAFFNIGGGNSHGIGAMAFECLQDAEADLLVVGNSILSGYSGNYFYNRAATQIQKRTTASVEVLARPSNSVNDINLSEIEFLNPKKILLLACSNDIVANGVATARANQDTLIEALGELTNSNAPLGYSIANQNLVISTEIPRFQAGFTFTDIQTFNSDLVSSYGITGIIDLYGVSALSSGVMPASYSFDFIHPNDLLNSILADTIIDYYNFEKSLDYSNSEFFPFISPAAVDLAKNSEIGNQIFATDLSGNKYIGYGAFNNGTNFTPRAFAAGLLGFHSALGLELYTNRSLTPGTAYTPLKRFRVSLGGAIINVPTAVAINTTTTVTAAQVESSLITSTSPAAVDITLPTATQLATQLGITASGSNFEFTIDNSAGANTVTVILGSGFTQMTSVPDGGAGDLTITSGQVGIFKVYFTGTTSAVISRIM